MRIYLNNRKTRIIAAFFLCICVICSSFAMPVYAVIYEEFSDTSDYLIESTGILFEASENSSESSLLTSLDSSNSSQNSSDYVKFCGAAAASGQLDGIGYNSILYTAYNGLPTSEANVVYSSSDGFIWIGGDSGLIRFDGTDFELQNLGFDTTCVTAIFEDSKKRLWVGTRENGLIGTYKGESYHFTDKDGLPSSYIYSIAEDNKGNIIAATSKGIGLVDANMNIGTISDGRISNVHVSCIKSCNDGFVYGVTENGDVFRMKDLTVTDFYTTQKIDHGKISSIYPSSDKSGEVYLGTVLGTVLRGSFEDEFQNIETKILFEVEEAYSMSGNYAVGGSSMSPILETVTQIMYASDMIWVLTPSKIFYGKSTIFDSSDNFVSIVKSKITSAMISMTKDFEGNLWFASNRQGVMKIVADKFFDLTGIAGLEEKVVNTTCIHNNMIFIGTDSGLQVVDNNLYREISHDLTGALGNTDIRCLTEDSNGDLWISAFNNSVGLVHIKDDKIIYNFILADEEYEDETEYSEEQYQEYSDEENTEDDFTEYIDEDYAEYTDEDYDEYYDDYLDNYESVLVNGMPSDKIFCTVEASDGSMLVGTDKGLVIIKDDKIERIINEADGLENLEIVSIEETDGKIYLGTNGAGIYLIENDKVKHISFDEGLSSDFILSIKKDEKRGILWIINSNSLQFIKDGELKTVEGFPYKTNYDIFFDNDSNAWIMSSNGFYVANANEMINKDSFDYVFYSIPDGLPSIPTAYSHNYLDKDGKLLVSGRTGVTLVNINEFFLKKSSVRFFIPYIDDENNNRYYPDSSNSFHLPSSAENLTIYCSVLTYMLHDPDVQYFLDGVDSQPRTVKKSEMKPIQYINLGGGKYRFSISLIDSSTHSISSTLEFSILIKKSFYEKWWFYVLCSAAALLAIALGIRYYLKRKTAVFLKKEKEQKRLFDQTATALVNAIDAKDKYTHGHSARVAEYSRKIAELYGKSKRECDQIYYAALLHDVGKIGVPGRIINKQGRLTDEEYESIKQHPNKGVQILGSITDFPYLSIGAHYHQERYDGKGYPERLKGDEIPEIARIVAVADAYDAMTSKRSYRDPIPQQKVREEFVKGAGTQFDPEFARIMLHLIDLDTEYEMKEREEKNELKDKKEELVVGVHRSAVAEGVLLNSNITTVNLTVNYEASAPKKVTAPSLILFDSLDGKFHDDEKNIKDMLYFEYGEIWFDGHADTVGGRKIQIDPIGEKIGGHINGNVSEMSDAEGFSGEYIIEAIRQKDHALVKIYGEKQSFEVIVALPDNTRYAYLGLTGEYCRIEDISIKKSEEAVPDGYIKRIAEEINYIDVPDGDIPNVQIDGFRTDASVGIPVKDGLTVSFFAKSLPTARLVWHCPYIDLFCSDDGKVNGENYRDLALIRLDGECWECDPYCTSRPDVNETSNFLGWDAWKEFNKDGFDSEIRFDVEDNYITIHTENAGILLKHVIIVNDVNRPIYASITGDQCAITNIRIK